MRIELPLSKKVEQSQVTADNDRKPSLANVMN